MSQGGFSNPLVGGGGALVYPSIHSPNFNQAAKTGWSIDKNGNAFFFGVTTSGAFTGTNFVINSAGAFFYSGTPALGNLIASVTNSTGTDAEGNAYLAGTTTYEFNAAQNIFLAASLQQGALIGYSAAVAGGPWTQQGVLSFAGGGTVLFNASANIEIDSLTSVELGNNGGQLLTIQNTVAAPSEPNFQIIDAAAGDNSIGIMVSGDTFNRIKMTTRAMLAGPGNATQDTQIYRSSAGVWGTDMLEQNVSGSAETWHSVAYSNSWTDATGRTPSQYRLIPSPANAVQLEGSLTIPAGFAGGQTVFTLPGNYRPVTTKSMEGREVTRNAPALFSISIAGLVAWQGAAGAVAGDTVDFRGIFQLDI
jgi:hypothetical protein